MQQFTTQTYDQCGRPYLTIPIPVFPHEPPASKDTQSEMHRGVVVIDMNNQDDTFEKFVFEF